MPPHHHLVTANDVTNGKPDPEPYMKGAAKLGVDTKNCESPLLRFRHRPLSSVPLGLCFP